MPMTRDYLLRKYDDVPPTHVLCEMYLPDGEMAQMRGYLFVPPQLARDLGEPDATVRFGVIDFPAWRLNGEMP